jgi:hypothetical protein
MRPAKKLLSSGDVNGISLFYWLQSISGTYVLRIFLLLYCNSLYYVIFCILATDIITVIIEFLVDIQLFSV